jgi:hypothetical protein
VKEAPAFMGFLKYHIDICSDLWKKHKDRKAQKNNTEVIDEEDPQPETAPEV